MHTTPILPNAGPSRLSRQHSWAGQPGRRGLQPNSRNLSLALQGGGSFGAFTWGVLDRLLEEDALRLDMVSGTSAGAVNAALLASGLAEDGPAGARRRLESFWTTLANLAPLGGWNLGVPGAALMTVLEISTHVVSPYQLNPLGLNPLRDLLLREVDFERLRAAKPVRLLIAATRVRDGQLRLFREDEITIEAVLASACLPLIQHAVEIDGEAYWDGGFSANPPLRQLALGTRAADVLLVQIMPEEYEGKPQAAVDISRRASIMAFNASLQREIDAVNDLRRGCQNAGIFSSQECRKLKRLRLHRIAAVDSVEGLAQASMLNTDPKFLHDLKESGRAAAQEWLSQPLS
ncbi:MAG: patatin-like phospholipase family protein [Acetobacteraceae bacterium]|nr:patatin-like phospholipase family protein [Acetobacteraceae bacterium]